VTYNPISKIDESKIVKRLWFQHVVHDVRHVTVLLKAFTFLQAKRHTYYCGAHTLMNSQEHCFISGLAAARMLGAEYPFADAEAKKWFNFFGGMLYGSSFREAA
jgi:predicted NAD/FAD-binding protein